MRWLALAAGIVSIIVAIAAPAGASPGTVWMTADIKSPQGRAEIRLPLEWLAATRTAEQPSLRVGGVRLDCVEMWQLYQGLPTGESRLVTEGITKDDERYLVKVVSETPASPATGKVRILNRDENGKETEVGFPLSFAKVLDGLSKVVPHWLDDDDRESIEGEGFSLSGDVEFTRLAEYGTFTVLDARDAKSRVRIWIE